MDWTEPQGPRPTETARDGNLGSGFRSPVGFLFDGRGNQHSTCIESCLGIGLFFHPPVTRHPKSPLT
jgi:hypothetical protein